MSEPKLHLALTPSELAQFKKLVGALGLPDVEIREWFVRGEAKGRFRPDLTELEIRLENEWGTGGSIFVRLEGEAEFIAAHGRRPETWDELNAFWAAVKAPEALMRILKGEMSLNEVAETYPGVDRSAAFCLGYVRYSREGKIPKAPRPLQEVPWKEFLLVRDVRGIIKSQPDMSLPAACRLSLERHPGLIPESWNDPENSLRSLINSRGGLLNDTNFDRLAASFSTASRE